LTALIIIHELVYMENLL